ncbi:5-formyltetrahydrofolate cyclo-ligase [Chryseobacterium sp.]|uniref:5-formyltetrahydrofolate cyclo-ligase n=1 Tax=Chryseobacterium sp. TaxID=1871047 RepID=UPI0011CC24A1|nr:5-formyltetrahydrofolate cyclo-ligase [Chryseobacterium sp.]TXF76243.1 5-formyltetrahydrofolate cyclo-ligase [Chryseobacterium sp.]
MNKSEIRKLYLQKRQTFSADEVFALSEQISKNFIQYFKPSSGQKVHCFLSIPEKGEVETNFLLDYFFENKIQVFVPKIVNSEMISVEITRKTTFKKNPWGIPEPESNVAAGISDFDYVITPLLYCDAEGHRVGYGKGFYDDFFTSLNNKCLKTGLNFFEPLEKIDDLREKDIALDYLITPTEVLSFGFTSKSTK